MKVRPLMLATLLATLPLLTQAHTTATHTVPVTGSKLSVAPTEFQLTFGEAVRVTKITLQKSGDSKVQDIAPLPKDAVQIFSVPAPKLGPGSYTLRYRSISADNHVLPGVVRFTIEAAAKSAAAGK